MDLILFGNARFASLAWHAVTHDGGDRVVGFTVHAAFNDGRDLHGLPVVDFETVEERFDPAATAMLVSLGWQEVNRLRKQVTEQAREKGYRMARHISSRAIVADGVEVGEGCMVFDGAIVQPFARIGRGTIVRAGAVVSHHVSVGAFSFLASGAVVGGGSTMEEGCFLGLNATVYDNVRLGAHTVVAAGAALRGDTEPGAVFHGYGRGRGTGAPKER